MTDSPLVSVIIPTRHRLELLQRAVDSVDRQGYANIEIVIVDNAADTPLTLADVRSRLPVRIVRTPKMLVLPETRNFGAARAEGEYLAFLDDDDEIEPMKTERQMKALLADPGIAFAYGKTRQIGPDGETIMVAGGPPDITSYLRWRYIHTNAVTVRRDAFEAVKYSPDMPKFQDVEFNGRMLLKFRGHFIDEVHALWYRDNRPDQITRKNWRGAYENWGRLCQRFDEVIRADPALRRVYHRKMLALALRFADLRQALISARLAL